MAIKCFYHEDEDATGICVNCGKMICGKCDVVIKGNSYCNPCVELIFSDKVAGTDAPPAPAVVEQHVAETAPSPVAATKKPVTAAKASASEAVENTSGQGKGAVIPPEVRGWSWGAFLMNWIWGMGNSVWIALLTFILGPIMAIVLGIKGNEWAWRNKKWKSVEKFKKTQRAWSGAGIGLTCLSIVLAVIIVINLPNLPAPDGGDLTATPGTEPELIAGSASNLDLELSSTRVEAGENITITVKVSPPQVTPVNASLDNQQNNEVVLTGSTISTDENGVATITRKVDQPGDVMVSVLLPDLGLEERAYFEVIPARPQPQREVTREETIGSGGGIVELPDGAGLILQNDALNAEVKVTASIVTGMPPSQDSNMKLGPEVYEFLIEGEQNPDLPPTFFVPYDENDLPSGVTADQLQIVYYNESAGEWIPLGGEVDSENRVIQLTTAEISTESRPTMSRLSGTIPQIVLQDEGTLKDSFKHLVLAYSYYMDPVQTYKTANFEVEYTLTGYNRVPDADYPKDIANWLETVKQDLEDRGFKTLGRSERHYTYYSGGPLRAYNPNLGQWVDKTEVTLVHVKVWALQTYMPNVYGLFVPGATDERSHLEIDNQLMGNDFFTTAAHEYFHITQSLYHSLNEEREKWFDEASALWYETLITRAKNKIVGNPPYLASVQQNVDFIKEPLDINTTTHGYAASIFVMYMARITSDDIVRQIYETNSWAIDAIASNLADRYGTKLEAVFFDFADHYCLGNFKNYPESALWPRPFGSKEYSKGPELNGEHPNNSIQISQQTLTAGKYTARTKGIKGNLILSINAGSSNQSVQVFAFKDRPRNLQDAHQGELTAASPMLQVPLDGGDYTFEFYAFNANRTEKFACNLDIGGSVRMQQLTAVQPGQTCRLGIQVIPPDNWELSVFVSTTPDEGGSNPLMVITDEAGTAEVAIPISEIEMFGKRYVSIKAESELMGNKLELNGSGSFTVAGITVDIQPSGSKLVVSGQVYPNRKASAASITLGGVLGKGTSAFDTDDTGRYSIAIAVPKDAKAGETGTATVTARVIASEYGQSALPEIIVSNSATYPVAGSAVPIQPSGPALDQSRVEWCAIGINVLSRMEATGHGAESVKELEPISLTAGDTGIMRGKFTGNTFTGSGNLNVSRGNIPASITVEFDPASQQITSFSYSVSGSVGKGTPAGRTVNMAINGSNLPYLLTLPAGPAGGQGYFIKGKQVCNNVTMSMSFHAWGVENDHSIEATGKVKSLECDDKSELGVVLGWGDPDSY
jgi:hypothetical protein